MQPLECIVFWAYFQVGGDKWRAEGVFECPDHPDVWELLTVLVRDTLWAEAKNLVQFDLPCKLKMEGDRFKVAGPSAKAMRKYFERCRTGKESRWKFELYEQTRYTPREPKGDGHGQG